MYQFELSGFAAAWLVFLICMGSVLGLVVLLAVFFWCWDALASRRKRRIACLAREIAIDVGGELGMLLGRFSQEVRTMEKLVERLDQEKKGA